MLVINRGTDTLFHKSIGTSCAFDKHSFMISADKSWRVHAQQADLMKLIDIIIPAPSVSAHTTGAELQRLFQRHPDLTLIAVLDDVHVPIGSVDRLGFLDTMSGSFGPALYLRRSVDLIMNTTPTIVEAERELASFVVQHTSSGTNDPLLDGLIVVQNGRYAGVASGPQILRAISLQALNDVQALQNANRERERTHALFRSVVQTIPDVLVLRQAQTGECRFVNHAGEKLLDCPAETILAHGAPSLPPLPVSSLTTPLAEKVDMPRPCGAKRTLRAHHVPIEQSEENDRLVLSVYEDITEKVQYERRITHLALHDALTGLPNRRYFDDAIATAVTETQDGHGFNLLSLDLDRFKPVNDQYGHGTGDLLLRDVANRLRQATDKSDATVFRLGGDEFAIIQRNQTASSGQALATHILDLLDKPFVIEGWTIEIGASIGLSQAHAHSMSAHTLIREADRALYAAKMLGGRLWRIFTPDMAGRDTHDPTFAADLAQALPRNELAVHFQPIYSPTAEAVIGFEALLRWTHPTRGAVAPDRFIPVAEATGLINRLGLFVLEQACLKLADLPKRLHISVNLSPRQFESGRLADQVADVIARSPVHPGRIWFEITESVLLHDTQRNLATLAAIRALGIRLAIDDFGTGYSSLHYVEAFTPDKIKIDRSFIARMSGSRNARAIINSVVNLAHNMGIEVTAEGVETEIQYETLCDIGCDEIQGFLIGRPASQPLVHAHHRQDARLSA